MKALKKEKIMTLLEYLVVLVIPLCIFLYITIRNKNRIENAETNAKNTVVQSNSTTQNEENKLIQQGLEYLNQKKFEKSIEINLKVIELNSKNATAYNNIGFAYGNLQKWDKGIEYCSKAIQLNPNFQLAKNNLNWMKKSKTKLDQ